MKSKRIQITIDISADCFNAMKFLREKHINSKELFRQGGEQLVIRTAEKNRFKSVKIKLPF